MDVDLVVVAAGCRSRSASSTLAVSAARSSSVARVQAMRTTVEASHSLASGQLVERYAAKLVEIAEAVADEAGIALADEGAARTARSATPARCARGCAGPRALHRD